MKTQSILALAIALCLGMSKAAATVIYNDGGVHEINSDISDQAIVRNSSAGDATTVNVVSGARIHALHVGDSSVINMSGGLIFRDFGSGGFLSARDNSVITISGGGIWSDLSASHTSQITISGGGIGGSLVAYDESQINVSGGVIGVNLMAADNSVVTISGGVIEEDLRAGYNSQVTIFGGSIGVDLEAWHNSQITIFGTAFNYAYGLLPSAGTLTGTLSSGETINTNFEIYDDASIVLVPEPATVLLLGFGAVILRKKR